jgi:hypothetical protein
VTLEERIVTELRAERNALPTRTPGPLPHGRSRRSRWLAVAVVLAVSAGGGWVLSRVIGQSEVAAGPNEVVLAGRVVVPVTGERVAVGGVAMDVAAVGPSLAQGVELPGTEVILDRIGPPGEAHLPNDTEGPMVYVGTVRGQAVVLHDDDPPVAGLGEELFSLISRLANGAMFCSNSDGCSQVSEGPLLGVGYSQSGSDPVLVNATGFLLPPETSAVSITTADGASYWQRPAGDTVTIQWEQANAPTMPYTFVGYDSAGSEIFREIFR